MSVTTPILKIETLDGLYVGQLSEGELRDFNLAIAAGLARRSYDGPGGFLGLAKVEVFAILSREVTP